VLIGFVHFCYAETKCNSLSYIAKIRIKIYVYLCFVAVERDLMCGIRRENSHLQLVTPVPLFCKPHFQISDKCEITHRHRLCYILCNAKFHPKTYNFVTCTKITNDV
jgi:hypothetical protein